MFLHAFGRERTCIPLRVSGREDCFEGKFPSKWKLRRPFMPIAILPLVFRFCRYCVIMGRGSSVGIATRYGLDGPGIESR